MSNIVFIDEGHGGRDSGAVGNGLREKDLTLVIGRKVGNILTSEYNDVRAIYARNSDKYVGVTERARLANNAKADFFLSIHINAGGGTGYEDFTFNGLSSNSPTDKKRDVIHAEVAKVLSKYGIRNRGKKKANLGVLRESRMSATLVEILFIDNSKDAELLKNSKFINDISRALAVGVARVLGVKGKPTKPHNQPINSIRNLYKVQVGAFKSKGNADNLKNRLSKSGYGTYVFREKGLHKVQVGAYSNRTNAVNMRDKLKGLGYDAFITN